MLNLRVTNRQTPTQQKTPNDIINEITALLIQHEDDGTLTIEQLVKIRDLAANRAKLQAVLPWL